MKVAFTVNGASLDTMVDERFGRCSNFLVVDTENNAYEVFPNQGQHNSGGAGITAAQDVVKLGVDAVVTGNVGPNALGILSAAGIQIYAGAGIPVKTAMAYLKQRKLAEINQAVPRHFGLNTGGR